MAQSHEWMFFDDFDAYTYDSKEAAFASNAPYRYWHMAGVKDRRRRSSGTVRLPADP